MNLIFLVANFIYFFSLNANEDTKNLFNAGSTRFEIIKGKVKNATNYTLDNSGKVGLLALVSGIGLIKIEESKSINNETINAALKNVGIIDGFIGTILLLYKIVKVYQAGIKLLQES